MSTVPEPSADSTGSGHAGFFSCKPTAAVLFAGGGGTAEGAKLAGVDVVYAANHDRVAVEIHARNHPDAIHVCQDLHQANFYELPNFDILLASPSCQGFSPARGTDRPRHDSARSTAWAVVSALEAKRPYLAEVENVPEFLNWVLYPAWKQAVQALGYAVSPHIVDAADHGVPQHRERVFILLTRSKSPLIIDLPKRPHAPVGPVIDFDSGNWSSIDKPGRSPKTLARVAAGRHRFGNRFVMPYYGSGSGLTGRSIDRPIGTITTRDRWAVVDGNRMRMLTKFECRDIMGFRSDYFLPTSHKAAVQLLGNAVVPVVQADFIHAAMAAA
ncbi:DNA cytosine methyltransferase [Chitiniphilus eburneus]|uniref:DNA cytosine methyltransferase n=1 Tax=Chitiniphilus eburneus TaxID=2571148 RepID=UPI0035CEDE21